jgi:hypothetical protein
MRGGAGRFPPADATPPVAGGRTSIVVAFSPADGAVSAAQAFR